MGSLTFTRSHELYPTRWCDLFDLFDLPGAPRDGWMLLDLSGAPCDVTQPQMRTMSQRLRKAQECAAAGGKYGLVQAVLLSMDSQPDCCAHWLRQSLALEACSKVLLPAAHEGQVDLGAARAAYQQLTPAEQQLWRQLQAARIQLKRNSTNTPGDIAGYRMDNGCIANVLAGVTGDPSLLCHEEMRRLLFECRWDLVCRLTQRYGLADSSAGPVSMQAAYNWALAVYWHHGKDHPEAKAARAAIKAADPEAYVPKLLVGLAYPPLSMAPASVTGSKMEAAGYVWQFGPIWAASGSNPMERMLEVMMDGYTTLSTPLQWLLGVCGIKQPKPQQQREVAGLRQLACGDPRLAHQNQEKTVGMATSLYIDNGCWPGCRKKYEEVGVAKLLRALVVCVGSMAALTVNLPAITAAPRLWEGLGASSGHASLTGLAEYVKHLSQVVVPIITNVLGWYVNHPPRSKAAAAALGFWSPDELEEIAAIMDPMLVVRGRWMWQCGNAVKAQDELAAGPEAVLHIMTEQLGPGRPLELPAQQAQKYAANGLLPDSIGAVRDLLVFLVREAAGQEEYAGTTAIMSAAVAAEEEGPAAGRAVLVQAGDPQEQRLYEQFPVWLDQLVSQVTGRRVTLVIEPKAAHDLHTMAELTCRMYLKDAASGQMQVFGWRQPEDVDFDYTYEGLVQAARRRGCRDPDLLQYCAGVEPYEGTAAAGSSSRRSSSSSSGGAARSSAGSRAAASGSSSAGTTAAAAAASSADTSTGGSDSSRPKPGRPCAACGEVFPKLKLCTRCRGVSYCSKECQVAHWKAGHKQVCKEQPAEVPCACGCVGGYR